ncbi:ABC transporter ATP-binding protein [Brumimicrobium aurantiacum]|uniref:ABC transporter ATP-binding protein n=1 Tax=Brumimicrobium aurantiacum TaxID=1737063 RepID=A0A3E1EYM2_9FLAO|nr:ABC transporter ATP-binding protein [Brumimicrobium aurantiacum]RFC54644.1 ABC transporter ATP-binding protein [Brumimicrobium aurantiacum]
MLKIKSLSKSFDKGKTFALDHVSFVIKKGSVCAIVGESGSGKTTLVRLISGLERPDDGEIVLSNEKVASLTTFIPPERRKIGMVFQEYALFPHLTIIENVMYGIAKHKDKKQIAKEMLDLVGLEGMEKRYPYQLSGGQQQRVALARALAPKPSLLILDEPFSNLDTMLKTQLRNEIFEIINSTGVTVLFVTHDTQDALTVADEILILHKGKLVQKDIASNLYTQPTNQYVASLFGKVLSLTSEIQQDFNCSFDKGKSFAIRNEHIIASDHQPNRDYYVKSKVIKSIVLGDKIQLTVKLPSGVPFTISMSAQPVTDEVYLGFNKGAVLEFGRL